MRSDISGDRLEDNGRNKARCVGHWCNLVLEDGDHLVHEVGGVLDHESPVGLSEASWVGSIESQGQAGEVGDGKGGFNGTGNGSEVVKDWRISNGLAVLQVQGLDPKAELLNIGICKDESGIWILGGVDIEALESLIEGSSRVC